MRNLNTREVKDGSDTTGKKHRVAGAIARVRMLAYQIGDLTPVEADKTKEKALIQTAKEESEKRTDSFGDFARVFEKVRAAQTAAGGTDRESRVIGQDPESITFGLKRSAEIGTRFSLPKDSKFNKPLELDRLELGESPTHPGITLNGVKLTRGVILNEDTGRVNETLSVTFEGRAKFGNKHDFGIQAAIDHTDGSGPIWTKSFYGDPAGHRLPTGPGQRQPTRISEIPPAPADVEAALSFVASLVPEVASVES